MQLQRQHSLIVGRNRVTNGSAEQLVLVRTSRGDAKVKGMDVVGTELLGARVGSDNWTERVALHIAMDLRAQYKPVVVKTASAMNLGQQTLLGVERVDFQATTQRYRNRETGVAEHQEWYDIRSGNS